MTTAGASAVRSPVRTGSANQAFLYGQPSPAAGLRVFCLPYAGKGASVYRRWWEASDRLIEFVPVQLPGRENRFREPLIDDMRELVESLAADIAPHAERPYALFGHSMGASIAFELAHRLTDLGAHRPQHLVVAGCAAPHRQQAAPSVRSRTDAELVTELRRLGGTPHAVLDDERLLAFALPVLRADWSVADGYGYRPTAALDVPITILGSAADPEVALDELQQWGRHTHAGAQVFVFPGDHFFVDRFPDEVRELMVRELAVGPADGPCQAPAPKSAPARVAGHASHADHASHTDHAAADLAATGRRALGDVDTNAWRAALHDLDAVALRAMTSAVISEGDGDGDRDGTPADRLARRLEVAPRHRWLLDRWVASLLAEGRVAWRDGALVATGETGPEPGDDDRVSSACALLGYGDSLRDFFLQCNRSLPRLLRDELTMQELFFAGGFAAAESAYRDNPMNRYLHAALCKAVARHVRNRAGTTPVRVLELGAGVGAVTSDLVPALGATGVELRYVFSDISPVFLTMARERFANYPFVEFEIIDINDGCEPLIPPADVVLSANVLHNAHDVGTMLARVRRMVADDGMLAFIESSREHYQLMASMLFMLSGRAGRPRPGSADFRATKNRICLTRAEWHEQLRRAAFNTAVTVPDPERDQTAVLEQYLYLATPARSAMSGSGGAEFESET